MNSGNTNWNHNAANRKGVPYRDDKTRQQYDRKIAGAENRADFRGRDPQRDTSREKAQATLADRGNSIRPKAVNSCATIRKPASGLRRQPRTSTGIKDSHPSPKHQSRQGTGQSTECGQGPSAPECAGKKSRQCIERCRQSGANPAKHRSRQRKPTVDAKAWRRCATRRRQTTRLIGGDDDANPEEQ